MQPSHNSQRRQHITASPAAGRPHYNHPPPRQISQAARHHYYPHRHRHPTEITRRLACLQPKKRPTQLQMPPDQTSQLSHLPHQCLPSSLQAIRSPSPTPRLRHPPPEPPPKPKNHRFPKKFLRAESADVRSLIVCPPLPTPQPPFLTATATLVSSAGCLCPRR